MKPFNLEKFLEGEPAITRDGRKVIDWHYFKELQHAFKLYALLSDGSIRVYTISGNVYENGDYNNLDLFMEEKEVELWVNVYKNKYGGYDSWAYDSESVAIKTAKNDSDFKGTYKLSIKE